MLAKALMASLSLTFLDSWLEIDFFDGRKGIAKNVMPNRRMRKDSGWFYRVHGTLRDLFSLEA
jgi:hypothetical protein